MISSAVLAAISGTIVAAQSSTIIPLMLPAVDPQALVASVIDASPAITTFAVQCADETKDGPECGLLHAQTVAQGPSTWSMHYSYSDAEYGSYEQDMECKINRGEDTIECEAMMIESYDGTTGSTTTTVSTNGLRQLFVPVTVTAGLDKLDPSPGATEDLLPATETDKDDSDVFTAPFRVSGATTESTAEPTAEPTAEVDDNESTESEESQSVTSQGTNSLSTPTPTPTPTGNESTTTETDNAAFPRATQNAILVGAAAFVGGVMML